MSTNKLNPKREERLVLLFYWARICSEITILIGILIAIGYIIFRMM